MESARFAKCALFRPIIIESDFSFFFLFFFWCGFLGRNCTIINDWIHIPWKNYFRQKEIMKGDFDVECVWRNWSAETSHGPEGSSCGRLMTFALRARRRTCWAAVSLSTSQEGHWFRDFVTRLACNILLALFFTCSGVWTIGRIHTAATTYFIFY